MTSRPRGRPRSFDADHALDRALDVFWARGFEASSLDDLCAAIGIARPSLYAAFGDKQALYLLALQRFRDRMADAYRTAMTIEASFRERTYAYFDAAIAVYTSGARGCFAVCTAPPQSADHPAIRAALAATIAEQDTAYRGMLERARARGELPTSFDPAAAARLLSAAQHSIAVRARTGASRDEITPLGRAMIDAVFGEPVPPQSSARRKPAKHRT